jgi:hypothetical protein
MSNNYVSNQNFNPLFKDKKSLQMRSNTRYNDRNLLDIQLKKGLVQSNLDRIDIEREEFMKNSYLEDNDSDEEFGSMTNSRFDNTLERGMPSRPTVNIRKNLHEQNVHPEYLLRKSREPVRNMNPFDPHATSGGFAEINADTKITQSTKVESLCSDNINSLSIFFVKNLAKILVTPFVISSIDIYRSFASLYISSKGNTEIELKNYFEFPRKELIVENFTSILDDLEKSSNQIKNGSCILFNKDLPINPAFCKYIDKLTKFRKIDLQNINNETNNINNIITQITQTNMKKSVSSQNLENLNVLLLTYSYINPTLLINNPEIKPEKFFSIFSGLINVNYLFAHQQVFGYAQHENLELIEICCENSDLMFGMIKIEDELNFKKSDLITLTKKLKPVFFNYVQFPMFNIKTKLKLKNVFKKSDLQTIFLDLNSPELFSEQTKLDEVLQNSEIKIDNKFKKVKVTNNYKSDKTYILDKSFVYYFRLRESNTFVTIGIF